MSERKKLATIDFIVDTDKSYEFIGEVDGSFNEADLKAYIKRHGIDSLCKHLSFLQFQVYNTFREINSEDSNQSAMAKSN